MFTREQIVNIGLSKIGQTRVQRLNPPVSPLEKHVSTNYAHWKRIELAKHKWLFARVRNYQLTLNETISNTPDGRNYKYQTPVDSVHLIRTRRTEWKRAGSFVYSTGPTAFIDYIRDVTEAEFDPMFVEVLAAKAALESVEYTTQSNSKASNAKVFYDEAVAEAKRNNAFEVGDEAYGLDDSVFPFISDRWV